TLVVADPATHPLPRHPTLPVLVHGEIDSDRAGLGQNLLDFVSPTEDIADFDGFSMLGRLVAAFHL
ncbi:MAG: hypothetical protein AB7W16_25050, partial [Candidatus Obscuribacterales bacterium]